MLRRIAPRHGEISLPVTVHTGLRFLTAELIEVSPRGSRIRGVFGLFYGHRVLLESLQPKLTYSGTVRWAVGHLIGVEHDRDLGMNDLELLLRRGLGGRDVSFQASRD